MSDKAAGTAKAVVKIIKIKDVEVTVQPGSLLDTLTEVAKLDNTTFKKLADAIGVATSPFEKRLLKPVVLGAVQNAFYKELDGSVPAICAANQKARIERYASQLEEMKNNDGKDLVSPKQRAASGTKAPKSATVYRLRAETEKSWKEFRGQKYLIIKTMLELKAGPGEEGCTARQIADTVRDTPETKAPSDKNVAFHINAFGHAGIVEKKDENGEWASASEKKAAPAKKAPAAKPAEGKAKEKAAPKK